MNDKQQVAPGQLPLVRRCAWCAPWFSNSPCVKIIEKNYCVSHGVCDTCLKVWKSNLQQKKTT